MPLAQRARQAGTLVRRLQLPGEDHAGILSELGELFPKYVFCFDAAVGLTVLVPANARINWSAVAQRQGQTPGSPRPFLVPQAFTLHTAWLIEVSEHQLILHRCRDGREDEIVREFQKAVGLTVDGIMGFATKAAMRAVANEHWGPAKQEPEPPRPTRWERLAADDEL